MWRSPAHLYAMQKNQSIARMRETHIAFTTLEIMKDNKRSRTMHTCCRDRAHFAGMSKQLTLMRTKTFTESLMPRCEWRNKCFAFAPFAPTIASIWKCKNRKHLFNVRFSTGWGKNCASKKKMFGRRTTMVSKWFYYLQPLSICAMWNTETRACHRYRHVVCLECS